MFLILLLLLVYYVDYYEKEQYYNCYKRIITAGEVNSRHCLNTHVLIKMDVDELIFFHLESIFVCFSHLTRNSNSIRVFNHP